MNKNDSIFVAGHKGLVGSELLFYLRKKGYNNIVTIERKYLDLTQSRHVDRFFNSEKPKYVFLAAAQVGGILANSTYPADFIYNNLMIQNNVIHSSYKYGAKKLLFLGSSCIYPKFASQPIKEESFLSGKLEPTNEPYAIAKIAGIKMCDAYRSQYGCNFISVMPTNLYGPNDNYDLQNSHVLAALIRKVYEAKISGSPFIELWGSGEPLREFMHVSDLAHACVFLMKNYNEPGIINIGSGDELSIKDLALLIMRVAEYNGELKFDRSKPDGTPRKRLDITKLNKLGFKSKINLEEGIKEVYNKFKINGNLDS